MTLWFTIAQSAKEAGISVLSNPIPTPTGKFFASFFQKRRENYYSN
jgi:hypothetical protein